MQTVADLIKYLQTLPQDAKPFFSVWGIRADADIKFEVRQPMGDNNLHDMQNGGKAVCISWTDNCAAHILIKSRKDGKLIL